MNVKVLLGYRRNGQPIYLARGGAEGDPPETDPRDAEIAALRKEKEDRDAAAREAEKAELEELRAFRAEQDKKAATAVKPPAKKTTPPPAADPATPPAGTAKKRGRDGAARSWFGSED
jgi:hypothetical protein